MGVQDSVFWDEIYFTLLQVCARQYLDYTVGTETTIESTTSFAKRDAHLHTHEYGMKEI